MSLLPRTASFATINESLSKVPAFTSKGHAASASAGGGRRAAPLFSRAAPAVVLAALAVFLAAVVAIHSWWFAVDDWDTNDAYDATAAVRWQRTANLSHAQCRACEATLGALEWRKPWWEVGGTSKAGHRTPCLSRFSRHTEEDAARVYSYGRANTPETRGLAGGEEEAASVYGYTGTPQA